MKLHRLAFVELRPAPPALRRLVMSTTSGPRVSIVNFKGCDDVTELAEDPRETTFTWGRVTGAPARVLLDAVVDITTPEPGGDRRIEIPREPRRLAENALYEAAGDISVLCQSQFEVYSPRPYIMLEPEWETERHILSAPAHIDLPPLGGGFAVVAPGGARNVDLASLLSDRPEGRALLAAALAAGHGVKKLHELIRVFENGFALAGSKLIKPLAGFLKSYPEWDLEYSDGEVGHWVFELRDPATHADLRRAERVVMDPDVEPYLMRIEQAAYDVVFNKEQWHDPKPRRSQRWAFASMNRRNGGIVSTEGGGTLRAWDDWDHYRAFRLNENYRIDAGSLPDGWMAGDWYFAESDGAAAERPEA